MATPTIPNVTTLNIPAGYAPQDLELAKFTVIGTNAYVNTLTNVTVGTIVAGSEYAQGSASPGTVLAPTLVYQNSGGTFVPVRAGGSALPTTADTLGAGEDLVNNVTKVEERFSYATNFGTAVNTIKSGAGFLHTISVTNPMMFGAAGTISIWDNTTNSGTPMGTITIPAGTVGQPFTLYFDQTFATGLTLSFGGTSLPYLNIGYR